MHELLQRILTNIQRLLQKERSDEQVGLHRKSSMDQLESIVQGEDNIQTPLFASTDERFISAIVELIKDVFLFEDRSVDDGI